MYGGLTIPQSRIKKIKQSLVGVGLQEVITYSLVSLSNKVLFQHHYTKGVAPVKLVNPMSEDRSTMRLSLLPSLLEVVSYNNARRTKDIYFFEIGSIYYQMEQTINESKMLSGILTGEFSNTNWNGKTEVVDFFLAKGILDHLWTDLGLKATYQKNVSISKELHPNRSAEIFINNQYIGFIGQLHPKYERDLGLTDIYVFEICLDDILHINNLPLKYEEISKFPSVERDLSFVVNKSISADNIVQTIQQVDPTLITDISIFDLYTGEKIDNDEYSIAVRLTFQGKETLNEDKINMLLDAIVKAIQGKLKAKLRD
jgi:phenylalanyl-tRNA synthetase beta chain